MVFVSVAAKLSENMLVAYTASEEMYCARLDDILSEETKLAQLLYMESQFAYSNTATILQGSRCKSRGRAR